MSWLRLDDGFVRHPKLAGWTAAQKWRWLELLSWCASQRTNGRIGAVGSKTLHPSGCTSAVLHKAVDNGLIDVIGDEMFVHDWGLYNGDLAARVAAYCERFPAATANDVLRFTGGTRAVVLELVREYRSGGSTGGSDRTTDASLNGGGDVSQSGTAAGTGPHPHKYKSKQAGRSALRGAQSPALPAADFTGIDDQLDSELARLKEANPLDE